MSYILTFIFWSGVLSRSEVVFPSIFPNCGGCKSAISRLATLPLSRKRFRDFTTLPSQVAKSLTCGGRKSKTHKTKKWRKKEILPGFGGDPVARGSLGLKKAPLPPRARIGKAPSKPNVLQAVFVKIVTEIFFWQCAFGELWNNRLGSRSQTSALKRKRSRPQMCTRDNKTT